MDPRRPWQPPPTPPPSPEQPPSPPPPPPPSPEQPPPTPPPSPEQPPSPPPPLPPSPEQPPASPPPPPPSYLLKDAAIKAAARVAEAENKEHLAIEAAHEVQEIEKLIEEAKAMLEVALEIYEKCFRGEVINLPNE